MATFTVEDSRIMDMWRHDYHGAIAKGNAPDYGEPTAMVVVAPGHYGDTAILMQFGDRYLSPYFNQDGEIDSVDGEIHYESEDASSNPRGWLNSMYGATDWADCEWMDSRPNYC